MMATGSSVHYVSGGAADHLGLPMATDTYRTTHKPQAPKPTGLDFDALAPTCKGCGEKSGTVRFSTGLCATCDPANAKKKAPKPDPYVEPRIVLETPTVDELVELDDGEVDDVDVDLVEGDPEPAGELAAVHDANPMPRLPQAAASTPAPVEAPLELGRQLAAAATALTRSYDDPSPAIQAVRGQAMGALEALAVLLDVLAPQPAAAEPATTPPAAAPADFQTFQRPRRRSPSSTRGKPVDEAAIVREYVDDQDSSPVIAERHGITAKRVRDILDRRSIQRRDDRATRSGSVAKALEAYDDDTVRLVVQAYQAGASVPDLATELGCSRKVATTILQKAGVELRPPAHIARTTVVDDDTAAEIGRRYAAGESSVALATEYRLRAERCRQIIVDQGITIRGKSESARHLRAQVDALGVTTNQIKRWAVEQGLLERVTRGLVAGSIVQAYVVAHQPTIQEEQTA